MYWRSREREVLGDGEGPSGVITRDGSSALALGAFHPADSMELELARFR
jgi:hypothetical protein